MSLYVITLLVSFCKNWTTLFWAKKCFHTLIWQVFNLMINVDVNLLHGWTLLCSLNKISLINFIFSCMILHKYVCRGRRCHTSPLSTRSSSSFLHHPPPPQDALPILNASLSSTVIDARWSTRPNAQTISKPDHGRRQLWPHLQDPPTPMSSPLSRSNTKYKKMKQR